VSDISEELLTVARAWPVAGWQQPDEQAIRAVHAEDVVDRSSAGRKPDHDSFWGGAEAWFQAFPDLVVTADDLIAAPARGMVTVRWSALGTHRAAFMCFAPTGRRIRFEDIEVIRIERGVVHERWGEWNGAEILAQLQAHATLPVRPGG
jgi:predicted ester cyclase